MLPSTSSYIFYRPCPCGCHSDCAILDRSLIARCQQWSCYRSFAVVLSHARLLHLPSTASRRRLYHICQPRPLNLLLSCVFFGSQALRCSFSSKVGTRSFPTSRPFLADNLTQSLEYSDKNILFSGSHLHLFLNGSPLYSSSTTFTALVASRTWYRGKNCLFKENFSLSRILDTSHLKISATGRSWYS